MANNHSPRLPFLSTSAKREDLHAQENRAAAINCLKLSRTDILPSFGDWQAEKFGIKYPAADLLMVKRISKHGIFIIQIKYILGLPILQPLMRCATAHCVRHPSTVQLRQPCQGVGGEHRQGTLQDIMSNSVFDTNIFFS